MRYDRAVLVQALIYHQATATSGCHCGWAQLGHSHAEHVADVYEQAIAAQPVVRLSDTHAVLVEPCPECKAGKHDNCDGTSWDQRDDERAPCPCAATGHAAREG